MKIQYRLMMAFVLALTWAGGMNSVALASDDCTDFSGVYSGREDFEKGFHWVWSQVGCESVQRLMGVDYDSIVGGPSPLMTTQRTWTTDGQTRTLPEGRLSETYFHQGNKLVSVVQTWDSEQIRNLDRREYHLDAQGNLVEEAIWRSEFYGQVRQFKFTTVYRRRSNPQ